MLIANRVLKEVTHQKNELINNFTQLNKTDLDKENW